MASRLLLPAPGLKAFDSSERLERDDCPGIVDTGNGLHLFVDKVADIGPLLDIEFDQEVEIAGGRVDFGRDLRIGERVCDRIGFAEMTFDLNEERDHAHLPNS